MTSSSSTDSCQDDSGEGGRIESSCAPYVRERNHPAVSRFLVQSSSMYEQLLWQEAKTYSNLLVCKTMDDGIIVRDASE